MLDSLTDDAWQSVHQRLPLKAFASLAACSKASKALVDSMPQTVWQAAAAQDPGEQSSPASAEQRSGLSVRQAVAAAYPAPDPLCHAPCTRAALPLRRTVHGNMVRGVARQDSSTHASGVASLDHMQHASVVQGDVGQELLLRDLKTGILQHRWPLSLPRECSVSASYTWRWGRQRLALPNRNRTVERTDVADHGILLFDVLSGACVEVELPTAENCWLHAWSSTGFLLANHGTGLQRCLSLVSAAGQCLGTVTLPPAVDRMGSSGTQVTWAPSGQVAFVMNWHGQWGCWTPEDAWAIRFMLWEISSGAPVWHQVTYPRSSTAAWSFDSSWLVLAAQSFHGWPPAPLLAWSLSGQHSLAMPGLQTVWGAHSRVAVFQQREWSREEHDLHPQVVRLYDCVGGVGGAQRLLVSLDVRPHIYCTSESSVSLSPDGTLLAVSTAGPDADGSRAYGVAVISFTAHCQQRLSLEFWAEAERLSWSGDSSTLLVSYFDYEQTADRVAVFDFG